MLQRWNPINEFERVWDEMDRMLSEGVSRPRNANRGWTFRPPIDLYDTGDEFVLRAMIPGARSEDLEVSINQNTLSIQGRFGQPTGIQEGQHVTWYRREIVTGQFNESLTLPVPVDSDATSASFEDGILTLTLPKADQARVRRISIQSPKEVEATSS